jgi:hypothetical protein
MESFLNYQDSPPFTPEPRIPLVDLTRSPTPPVPPAAEDVEMKQTEEESHNEMGDKEKKEVVD